MGGRINELSAGQREIKTILRRAPWAHQKIPDPFAIPPRTWGDILISYGWKVFCVPLTLLIIVVTGMIFFGYSPISHGANVIDSVCSLLLAIVINKPMRQPPNLEVLELKSELAAIRRAQTPSETILQRQVRFAHKCSSDFRRLRDEIDRYRGIFEEREEELESQLRVKLPRSNLPFHDQRAEL